MKKYEKGSSEWHDDWRIQGQEDALKNKLLRKFVFSEQDGDHDHCVFCWHKFMKSDTAKGIPDCSDRGYIFIDEDSGDKYRICHECFEDFREVLGWTVKQFSGGF